MYEQKAKKIGKRCIIREFFDASSRKLRVEFAQTLHEKRAKGEKSFNERAFFFAKGEKHVNERAIFF